MVGLSDGPGDTAARGVGAAEAVAGPAVPFDVVVGGVVAGAGEGAAARRFVSESSWKNTMFTGTKPLCVSTKLS
jgi:hypothetical protein